MAVSIANVRKEFENRDIEVGDTDVLAYCSEVCITLGKSAEELVDMWESFSLRTNQAKLSHKAVEAILQEEQRKARKTPASRAQRSLVRAGRSGFTDITPQAAKRLGRDASSLAQTYGAKVAIMSPPPAVAAARRAKRALSTTPGRQASPQVEATPTLATKKTPATTPATQPFAARKGAGETVEVLNEKLAVVPTVEVALARSTDTDGCPPRCDVVPRTEATRRAQRFLHSDLARIQAALEARVVGTCERIRARARLPVLTPLGEPRHDDVYVGGRVLCDAEGTMNRTSVVLEGSLEESGGKRVALDLRIAEEFALFPGQVVVARGTATRDGARFVAKEIFADAGEPLTATPASQVRRFQHSADMQGGKPLNIWAAQGPYTASDNLDYEPLRELISAVLSSPAPPDVAVLHGPFVDERHTLVAAGQLDVPDGMGGMVTLSPQEMFELKVVAALDSALGMGAETKVPTRFVLVPSTRDAHARPQYPQVAFSLGDCMRRDRISSVANPSTFRVNEVVVGVNSHDVIRHTMHEGDVVLNKPGSGNPDRMHRIVTGMLQQQSFYPLYPAPQGTFYDVMESEHMLMQETPDVLITCSQFKHFARIARGTLAVNPGPLSRVNTGGTFAKLCIHPAREDFFEQAGEEPVAHEVAARTRCEIVRI